VPVAEQHDHLTGAGCDDGNDHEDHHDQRHHFRHLAAAEDVTNDRDSDDAGRGRADALDEAQQKQRFEGRNEDDGERGDDIDRQADDHRHAPAETVGDRSVEELRDAEADEIGGDDILAVVFVLDIECGTDLLEARQHDVDGKRVERHEEGHHRDEFGASHAPQGLGGGL
jgi:hypothetical protein